MCCIPCKNGGKTGKTWKASAQLSIEKIFDMILKTRRQYNIDPADTVILSRPIRIYIQTLRRFEVMSICNVSLIFIYIATTPEDLGQTCLSRQYRPRSDRS